MNQTAANIRPSPTSHARSPNRSLSSKHAGGLLLLAILWGLSIPVTKLGLATMPPLTLTALRFAVAVPLLFLFVIGRQRLPRQAFLRVAILGILGVGVGQVAQTLGVVSTSASAGTVISATIPLFVVIFAALRLKQPVTAWQAVGLLSAFAGIALVASGSGEAAAVSKTTTAGISLMLLSALAVAFYYVWSVTLTNSYGITVVTAWSTLFGFLALLPWAGWEIAHTSLEVTAEALCAGVYLGLAVTAAGMFLWLWLLKEVPARVAASVQYLQPVVGVAASAVMFGDSMGLRFVGGVALILAGLALVISTRSRRRG